MLPAAIISFYHKNKVATVLFVALLLRVLSAVFSTGYGMHDDHFITIEVAQSWIDGENMNGWLPDKEKGFQEPSGHSLTYPSLMCGVLYALESMGITHPADKMLWIRLLHALLSTLVVYWGYKIMRHLYDEKSAILSAWALALFWMFPMLGVRNLVEVVCIPPLFAGTWMVLNNPKHLWRLLYAAGVVTGLAFSIRFQTGFYLLGMGLAIWIQQGFLRATVFGLGVMSSVLLLQGVVDIYVWGYPFAELGGYIDYNLKSAGLYPNGPWYNYLLLLAGVLIPPYSFFIVYGFIKEWKKILLIALPVILFVLFHSYFPNKQERFILPVVPFILIAGLTGWHQFTNGSAFWKRNSRLLKGFFIFSVSLNMVLLLLLSFSSSKKNRVDAMLYLSRYRNIECLAIENSNHENSVSMPKFYLDHQWPTQMSILSDTDISKLKDELSAPGFCKPPFIVFLEEKNIEQRVEKMKQLFPALTYETTIQPSFTDEVMHWLNPKNVNQVTYIYKTGF